MTRMVTLLLSSSFSLFLSFHCDDCYTVALKLSITPASNLCTYLGLPDALHYEISVTLTMTLMNGLDLLSNAFRALPQYVLDKTSSNVCTSYLRLCPFFGCQQMLSRSVRVSFTGTLCVLPFCKNTFCHNF